MMAWWRQLTRKINKFVSRKLEIKQGRIRETRRMQVWQGGFDMDNQVRLMGRLGQQLIAENKQSLFFASLKIKSIPTADRLE